MTQVPLLYELAYGGLDVTHPEPLRHRVDLRNPVGRGVTADPRRLEGHPAHHFEYANGDFTKTGPAGFGAIASHWSPRLALQGTYDQAWMRSRMPLLPLDWSPQSLLCSPADQRAQRHLRGGELVELLNLTPQGVLRFTLPKVYLTYTTHFATVGGRRVEEHRGRLSTVIIEPDIGRLSLVWQSALLVHRDEDDLEHTQGFRIKDGAISITYTSVLKLNGFYDLLRGPESEEQHVGERGEEADQGNGHGVSRGGT